MKHKSLRDFIYDKNDILLALAVLIVAALLIYWRMSVIMDYPQTLAEETHTTDTTTEQAVDDGSTADSDAAGDDASDDGSDSSSAVFTDGQLTKDVTVTVQSGSASGAVGSLVDAGLFADYDEFTSVCASAGCRVEDIKAATFTFPAGSTQADIARRVTD